MSYITQHFNQISYVAAADQNKMYVSAQSGSVLPYFSIGEKQICPYQIAPWWDEKPCEDKMLYALRGSFLCMPMGGDAEGYNTNGRAIPCHGSCANGVWELTKLERSDEDAKMVLQYEEQDGQGRIRKELTLMGQENVLYERDIISGYEGKYPIAFHPNLRLNEKKGSCHISISPPVMGSTTETYHENTENGGYVLLKKQRIPDRTKVESIYGDMIDLSHQPLQKGIEEMVMFVSDADREFCYTALTNPEEGYVYFQLKNPEKLQSTMMWISNGGRHYEPWKGRVANWIGLEETTSYFHYGVKASVEPNFVQETGAKTYVELTKEKDHTVELIIGMAEIPAGFTGVKDIEAAADGICILGENGEKIRVKADLSFLNSSV